VDLRADLGQHHASGDALIFAHPRRIAIPMSLRPSLVAIVLIAIVVGVPIGSADAERAKQSPPVLRYWIQVGAYKSIENARARCAALVRHRYSFAVQHDNDSHGQALFFCRSSQSLTRGKAAPLAARLRTKEAPDAVLVLAHPVTRSRGRPPAETAGQPNPLAALSGAWCGDPAIYGDEPLQIWTVTNNRATLRLSGQTTPDRKPEEFQDNIKLLSDHTIQLTDDTPTYHSEAIYELDGVVLTGISYHQDMKNGGMSLSTVPDTLHRCP
jgi:hypothetical protein